MLPMFWPGWSMVTMTFNREVVELSLNVAVSVLVMELVDPGAEFVIQLKPVLQFPDDMTSHSALAP